MQVLRETVNWASGLGEDALNERYISVYRGNFVGGKRQAQRATFKYISVNSI